MELLVMDYCSRLIRHLLSKLFAVNQNDLPVQVERAIESLERYDPLPHNARWFVFITTPLSV